MNTLLALIILLAIVAYGHKEYMQAVLGCSPKNAPRSAILALSQYLRDLPSQQNILDLGSGWGNTIYSLSDFLPRSRIFGIEASFTPWLVSHLRSIGSNRTNLRLIKESFFEHDLRPYDILFCNLPAKTTARLMKRFERELAPGTLVIAYARPLQGWIHMQELKALDNEKKSLFVYEIGSHKEEPIPASNESDEQNANSAAESENQNNQPRPQENNTPKHFKPGLILGHRGTGVTMYDSSEEEDRRRREGRRFPENTYEACMKALQSGADGVEVDVLVTQDKELVICHDDDLNLHVVKRGGKDMGRISQKTFADVRSYDIGDGLRIPLLDDILHLITKYDAVLNIELKAPHIADILVDKINEYVQSFHLNKDNIVISSFDHAVLKEVRDLDSTIKIGLLFQPQDRPQDPIYPDDPTSPSYRHFSADYIKKVANIVKPTSIHLVAGEVDEDISYILGDYDLQLFIWSLDEPKPSKNRETISLFYNLKKTGFPAHLITDYPDAIHRLVQEDDSAPTDKKPAINE